MNVVFRYPMTTADVIGVELAGETSDWLNALPLQRQDDGSFAREIALPAGVYQYKLVVHRGSGDARSSPTWELDPGNPRTRSSGGDRNSVLTVDGPGEPWLFAPAAPWIEELADGRVRVLVGLRRGHGAPVLRVSHDDGRTWEPLPVEAAFEEDEHVFFTATFASTSGALLFEPRTTTGAAPLSPIRWSPADLPPGWWRRATAYCVLVDRFRRHDAAPPASTAALAEGAPFGGDLDGVRRSLDHLRALGVDAIYLTPVHVGASAHRYDVVDPLVVDPELGGEAAYAALVEDARAREMRIIQDQSLVHVGRGFPAYEDVLAKGRASRWASWFRWHEDALVHYGRRTDAPVLDLDHPEVRDLAVAAAQGWAGRGASGLRLDMTAEVPLELGRRIRAAFREIVPDGVVFGEVVPRHAWRWRLAGVIDAATDFDFHRLVTEVVRGRRSAASLLGELARSDLLRGGDPRVHTVRFLSTHDHARLATIAAASGATARLPLAYLLLATLPGIPMLLYGEELGLRARTVSRTPEDVWPDRMPMPWRADDLARAGGANAAALAGALDLRRRSSALQAGAFELLLAEDGVVAYRRATVDEIVDVILNFDDEGRTIELDALDDDGDDRAGTLFAVGHVAASQASAGLTVSLASGAGVVLRRRAATCAR